MVNISSCRVLSGVERGTLRMIFNLFGGSWVRIYQGTKVQA